MSKRSWCAVGLNAVLAACGAGDQAPDSDGAVSVDAGPRCDPAKPFATIRALTELNSSSFEHGADLSPDELEIFFSSKRAGNDEIYRATRTSLADSFGSPELVGVNTSGSETFPRVSRDRLSLYFTRAASTGDVSDLYVASRATPTDPFTFAGAVALASANSAERDTMPYLSGDEQALYFISDRTGFPAATNIFRSVGSGSTFQAPTLVSELSSDSDDSHVVLTHDQLGVYFASDRPGVPGQDIWYASRSSTAEAFGNLTNVAALDTQQVELPQWISADNCVFVFSSDRPGGMGSTDLWTASRPK